MSDYYFCNVGIIISYLLQTIMDILLLGCYIQIFMFSNKVKLAAA